MRSRVALHLDTVPEAQIAWAAGLLIGEGCICVAKSRGCEYLTLQLSMYDERAIARFASIFGVPHATHFYAARQHMLSKIHLRGRLAERVIARMWPYLEGTDKGDQAMQRAQQLGVEEWITGKRKGLRPEALNRMRGRVPARLREVA